MTSLRGGHDRCAGGARLGNLVMVIFLTIATGGCGRQRGSPKTSIGVGSSAPAGSAAPMTPFPTFAQIERYCVAVASCVPSVTYSEAPALGPNTVATCVRDVVTAIGTTTILDGSLAWLDDCGRGARECGYLSQCGVRQRLITY